MADPVAYINGSRLNDRQGLDDMRMGEDRICR